MALKLLDNVFHPDVLSCLADLSNDEVFTPPKIAKEMLDMLPQELFRSPDTKFLDPACKSGIFLREITERLNEGLKDIIPDPQKRIDHILHNQVYGIAITQITALLSRRSVYCSKDASGQYSLSHFDTSDGNIRFKETKHYWENGSCKYCGASKSIYDREQGKELHAYEFIHKIIREISSMKFDVIISNPPYQLKSSGFAAQAKPIYQYFVQQALKMNPKYVVMITPSRWFAAGWGLEDFRKIMIEGNHIREIHDYINAIDCFGNGVEIKGGASYFLWDSAHPGQCQFTIHWKNKIEKQQLRYLKEKDSDVLIRFEEGVSIYRKVHAFNEPTISQFVSTQKPFGLKTSDHGASAPFKDSVTLYERGGIGYISRSSVSRNQDLIDRYKVYISAAYNAGDGYPHQILGKPIVGNKNSCCTETYLCVGPFASKHEAENVASYMRTKFFRALVMLRKISQHAQAIVYSFVPVQDFSKSWTDTELYKKYGLTQKEIDFIESMIKPMELGGDSND